MNIDNVVLVRAMNNVPLNGELVPSCEGKLLELDNQSEFYYFLKNYIENILKQKLGRELLLYYESDDYKLLNSLLNKYCVLTGPYYTSTLSFSLNGLVPDDINNIFSNMKMAVLEPLKNQVNANFVTVETIDTTIKGRIKTSKDAVLLIDEVFFSNLSVEEQDNLKNNYKIKFFKNNLREAVSMTLQEMGYPSLPLVQNKELYNIEDCPLKESLLLFEEKFSNVVKASNVRLHYLTYMYSASTEIDKLSHDKISEEHPNTLKIQEYYRNQLYNFMLLKADILSIDVSDEDRYYLFTDYNDGIEAMQRLVIKLIDSYGGLENFSQFIQEYNNYVKENYLSNQQIISLLESKNNRFNI